MEADIRFSGRKATHDFLSLYSSLMTHVEQEPAPSQGGYLKTHDFLQPLERVFKNATKEENGGATSGIERPPVPVVSATCTASAKRLLPGGIGTYNISYFNQRVMKPEGTLFTSTNDENSNNSSHGFTMWDESAIINKGKTGKENVAAKTRILREEASVNVAEGQFTSLLEKPSQSSSNHEHTMTTFSSFSSSRPSSCRKNHSFIEIITPAKDDQEANDEYEEDEIVIEKDHSFNSKGNLPVKVEAKIDQKPNTPRSKHSATEQRRRIKINDRFQKLREIIPKSDPKRDKASFLLEVIGYIDFLQEKVNRYESPYNNHEPSKVIQRKNKQLSKGFLDQTQEANNGRDRATVLARTFDENKDSVSPWNLVDTDMSIAPTTQHTSQQPESTHYDRTSTAAASPVSPKQPPCDTQKTMTWPPYTKDQELTVESGNIDVSSVYSERFLNTLTQALQSSGVDLSRASISVQIDLGKRANCVQHTSKLHTKEEDVSAALPRSRAASANQEFGHALKRLRTS